MVFNINEHKKAFWVKNFQNQICSLFCGMCKIPFSLKNTLFSTKIVFSLKNTLFFVKYPFLSNRFFSEKYLFLWNIPFFSEKYFFSVKKILFSVKNFFIFCAKFLFLWLRRIHVVVRSAQLSAPREKWLNQHYWSFSSTNITTAKNL